MQKKRPSLVDASAQDAFLRFEVFTELFAKLNGLGGRWSAQDIVFEHTMQDLIQSSA